MTPTKSTRRSSGDSFASGKGSYSRPRRRAPATEDPRPTDEWNEARAKNGWRRLARLGDPPPLKVGKPGFPTPLTALDASPHPHSNALSDLELAHFPLDVLAVAHEKSRLQPKLEVGHSVGQVDDAKASPP